MWYKLLFYALISNLILCKDVGDRCEKNSESIGNDGTCELATDCEVSRRAMMNRKPHDLSRCGFSGLLEIVCCPDPENRYGTPATEAPTQRPSRVPFTTSLRIADRECQKITADTIPPINLNIIDGELASIGEFPHMVSLGYGDDDSYKFDCGGTLISRWYVMTAAHCVVTLEKSVPSIARMGVVELGNNVFDPEIDIRITRIIPHPDYKRREKYNDIALLRLEQAAPVSSTLNPACLHTSNSNPRGSVTVTGWGATSTTKDIRSTALLKANLTMVPRDRCNRFYETNKRLPQGIIDTQLCAIDPEGSKDACQGDSGGPLQELMDRDGQYRVVGITSFGRGCASSTPGVYTRVASFLDWIESIVWPDS